MSEVNYGIRITANASGVGETFAKVGQAGSQSAKQLQQAAESYVKGLKDEAATLGMNALQIKAYKGDQLQLSAVQKEAAAAALVRIRQHQDEQTAMQGLMSTARNLGAVVGGAIMSVAGALGYQMVQSINAAAAMATLSEKTGVEVEELARLKYAADVSDTSINTLARSMQRLPKALAEARNPNSNAGRAFAFLEIDPSTLKTQQQAIDAIADAIKRVEDPMAASAALSAIFKGFGEELIPFFKNGADGLRKLAIEGGKWAEISGINATQAKALKDNMVTLNIATGETAKVLGADLVVGLNNAAEAFLKNAREGNKLLGVYAAIKAMFLGNEQQQNDRAFVEAVEKKLQAEQSIAALANVGGSAAALGRRKALRELEEAEAAIAQRKLQQAKAAAEEASKPPPGKPIKGGADALGKEGREGGRAAAISEAERYIKTLQREAETLGMTGAEQRRYNLIVSGAAGAQREAGLEQIRRIDAYEVEKAKVEALNRVQAERIRLQASADEVYARNVEAIGTQAEHDAQATEQLRLHNHEIGLTTAQLRELRIARADETVAKLESAAADAASEPGRERELQLLERRIQKAREYANEVRRGVQRENDKDRADEASKRSKEVEDENKRDAANMERELKGALMRGFEAGKDAGRVFLETLANMARTTILEPMLKPVLEPVGKLASEASKQAGGWLGNLFGDLFGGGGVGAATSGGVPQIPNMPFAGGGIMTSNGPVPLRKYSGGGIASSPQAAIFGEGSTPEAYVPVPNGRIPVELGGGGGMSLTYAPTISIDARNADAGVSGRLRSEFGQLLNEHRKHIAALVERQANNKGRRLGLAG